MCNVWSWGGLVVDDAAGQDCWRWVVAVRLASPVYGDIEKNEWTGY